MAGFEQEYLIFSRRNLTLGGVQGLLFLGLAARLQYLQIVRSEDYTTLAEANRVNISLIATARGRIFDRNGILLAENARNLVVELIPEQAGDLEQTLARLQKLLDLSPPHMREVRRRIKRTPSFKAITIAEDLQWEKFSRLNLQLPFLAGVEPRVGEKRVYLYGPATAHLVGYVGLKTKRDLQRLGNVAARMVGQSGVEREFENVLRGKAGVRHVEVNSRGRTVRELSVEPGQAGQDLKLTLDVELQKFTTQRLKNQSGSIVVMDVWTGDILSMVSMPTFDPNQLSHGIDVKSWEGMLSHERQPLLNKAMRGLYAPGSTFKMLVALAALEAGVVSFDEKMHCSGVYHFAGESFHCWRNRGHGKVNLMQAVTQSCDSYFYEIALRTGIDRIEVMARRFGFGTSTGINLSGEMVGIVPGRLWKRANLDASWRSGETVITGIGQGFLLTSPLQLVRMTAALANGGALVTPRIFADPENLAEIVDLGINQDHLRVLHQAMYRVVNRASGTAYNSSLLIDGQRMSGKTGTVQVRRISTTERKTGVIPNRRLSWRKRDHSLFVGYAPHNKPRYAIAVVIEHGGSGARVAAPMARDIMVRLLSNQQFSELPLQQVEKPVSLRVAPVAQKTDPIL